MLSKDVSMGCISLQLRIERTAERRDASVTRKFGFDQQVDIRACIPANLINSRIFGVHRGYIKRNGRERRYRRHGSWYGTI